jgi:Uma2 family endonuclease
MVTRLATRLAGHLHAGHCGEVVAPGAVQSGPSTQLLPDVLVLPHMPHIPLKWRDVPPAWLAVEVLIPASHLCDRDHKRDAYLQLGVREVWLVDLVRQRIMTTETVGRDHEVSDHLVWLPPAPVPPLEIVVQELFEGFAPGWEQEQ